MLGLDAAGLKSAVAIAVTQASGSRVAQGTMAAWLLPAHAARAGIVAAFMARGGMSVDIDALGGKAGFLRMFSQEPCAGWLEDDLAARYKILANTYKPFPCGIVVNPVIEACLALKAEHRIEADAIARVELSLNPKAIALTDRRQPKDSTAAQVRFYHWAAVSLLFGQAGLGQLAELIARCWEIEASGDVADIARRAGGYKRNFPARQSAD